MGTYLLAAGLTLVIEVPLYVVALTAVAGIAPRRAAAWAVGVNVATHPWLYAVLLPSARAAFGSGGGTAAAEGWAVIVEAGLLSRLLRGQRVTAMAAAVLANACSFLAGAALLP